MQTYTPPGGNTVPGNQVNDSLNLMTTAAANPTSLPSMQQLGQTAGAATQQLASMQTPQARQGYIQNSDAPMLQSNYENLARQLYNYDKVQMAPQYGVNPGVASDALSFGRVGPSSLQQLTPEAANNPTLFADNPKYGIASSVESQSNILDLLNTLNDSLAKEFTSAKGKYASTVNAQQVFLDSIFKALGVRSDMDQRKEALAWEKEKFASDTALKRVELAMREKELSMGKTQADKEAKYKENLAKDVKKSMNLKEALSKYSPYLEEAEIISIYDKSSPWGPHKETAGELSSKLGVSASAVKGLTGVDVSKQTGTGSIEDRISSLPAASQTEARKTTTGLREIARVRQELMDAGATPGNSIQGIGQRVTGPLVGGILSSFGNSKVVQARRDLDRLTADIRKGLYGATLSKYELAASGQTLPSSQAQEGFNLGVLESLSRSAKDKILSYLPDITEEELDQITGTSSGSDWEVVQ